MLLAGHETTANTLLYATLLLAQHPAFQEKVLGEIDRIHERAKVEGRTEPEYEDDFGEAKWLLALMVRPPWL
jgi:cytochrome P450